jgi:hypothetical protein
MPLFADGKDVDAYRVQLGRYIDLLPGIRDEKVSASLPIFPKQYYTDIQFSLRKWTVYSLKAASRFLGPIAIPDTVDLRNRSDYALVWKSIEALGRLGVLARLRPDARCIIILRHPCGYVASVLRGEEKQKFEGCTPASEDWGIYEMLLALPQAKERGMTIDQVKAMTEAERLAFRWALYYEHALAETNGLENVAVVRYEDFCEHPMEEAKRTFDHCKLGWSWQTENFILSSTTESNSDYYSVFKNPLESAWKWRKELTEVQVNQILAVASQFTAGRWYSS